MPQIIRSFDNRNAPIIAQNPLAPLVYFNLVRLARGQRYQAALPAIETVYVVLSGTCEIQAGAERFSEVGRRADIWSGSADSVYASAGAPVTVTALSEAVEIAIAGGLCLQHFDPFRVAPEDVDMVDVGSPETHSRRRIFHILGNRHAGRAGNLLVSELYCDEGCWSGYPAHKHDTDTPREETCHEEVYHYRFSPENGFGCQIVFQPDGASESYLTRDGDTVIVDRGYHPTATSPGHREYIFTILVGKTQRPLIQNFKEDYRYMMEKIPGIAAMRDKFK